MKEKVKVYCNACDGTGLYKGFGEQGKAFVVCASCDGTGCEEISFERFEKRRLRKGVGRVFESSFGYGHTDKDIKADGRLIRFTQGGCTYKEWLAGVSPRPVKDLYCPYIYRNEGVGHELLKRCKEDSRLGGRISECKFFGDKEECWKQFEAKFQR